LLTLTRQWRCCRLGIELERWAADDNRRVKQRTRADEVYQAICAVLGASVLFIAIMWRFGPNKSQYGRVMFSIPDPRRNVWHNIITDDALTLDAITFCRDIMAAARTWFSTKQNDPTVQANISAMVQLRPNGFPPYIVGLPSSLEGSPTSRGACSIVIGAAA
jgi:hypothetical protein